jgi:hypothetical protein
MEAMAFEQGIGLVPFGGIALQAFETIHASESKEPIIKATSVKILVKDPGFAHRKGVDCGNCGQGVAGEGRRI